MERKKFFSDDFVFIALLTVPYIPHYEKKYRVVWARASTTCFFTHYSLFFRLLYLSRLQHFAEKRLLEVKNKKRTKLPDRDIKGGKLVCIFIGSSCCYAVSFLNGALNKKYFSHRLDA